MAPTLLGNLSHSLPGDVCLPNLLLSTPIGPDAIVCCLASLPLFVGDAALAQEFKPLPLGKLVGSLDKFMSPNAAHSFGSVELHCGDQTKCLPSSFFANCVSSTNFARHSFVQSDEKPMLPQEMGATLQHGRLKNLTSKSTSSICANFLRARPCLRFLTIGLLGTLFPQHLTPFIQNDRHEDAFQQCHAQATPKLPTRTVHPMIASLGGRHSNQLSWQR